MSQPPEHPGNPEYPDNPEQAGGSPGLPPGPPPGYGPLPGYGSPPGYGPPPGFGGPPGPPFSISEAFGWAWKKFRQNAAALIVPVLVYGLLLGAAYGLIALSTGMGTGVGTNSGDSTSAITNLWPGEWAMMVIGYLLVFAVGVFAQSAFLTGCLDIADGRPVTIGSFFRPRNFGTVILAALLVSVLSTLASALCFLPGLIFGIFAMFTVPFAIDRAQPPVTALTASLSTVWSNFGNALLAWLVEVVVIVVGALACGLGLLVGLPVAALILIYTFRTLSGGRVVPLEQGYPQGPPPGYQPS